MIFQPAERRYGVANLYDKLVTHYALTRPTDALGKTYDYQMIYEHSALAACLADSTKSYRFVRLPDVIGLGNPDLNHLYRNAGVVVPGLHAAGTEQSVRIPATRVTWGLTVLNGAPNRDNAIKFLQLLFGPEGVAVQSATGPAPISPPIVGHDDFDELPPSLRSIVGEERRDR
jgi:molybdate/tungstate transport system substrate-binding protein